MGVNEWRNMFGRKEKQMGGGACNMEILALGKVLSLVLTSKGPWNNPESVPWTELQTPCNFLLRRLGDFRIKQRTGASNNEN